MKSTLRFLIPTLLLVAACGGGGGGGDDTPGDDGGPGVTCAMATSTIAVPGMATGTVKGAGADLTATEMSCAQEPFYTNPDGEDTVVELSGLTVGKHYGITVSGMDDLAFYVTTDCPMGGAVTSCALYNDTANAGEDEIGAITATAATEFVVVDFSSDYNDPTMIDGAFTVNVVEAECTVDTEATDCGAATPICGGDFKCHQCGSDSDCSGATPQCGTDFSCKAGPALCVNDDAGDSGNGDDAISVAQMIAAPTANNPTIVTGRICSSDDTEVDWYKVTLAANVGITLTMDPTVDLDLYLYDADGRSVDKSETDALGGNETILTTDITASGTYYIVVHQYAPADKTATTPYTLRLAIPTCDPQAFLGTCTTPQNPVCGGAGECAPGPAQCTGDDAGDNAGGDDSPSSARNLTPAATSAAICSKGAGEADWYKFTAVAGTGETITLDWTGAKDLDLYVYDSTGKEYGTSFYKQPEVVTLTQLPAGTYYARVVNYAGNTPDAAATAYTITGAITAPTGCTTSASCGTEYHTQKFRGSCATVTGVCSFLPAGGAAGAACDSASDSCDDNDQCSYIDFQTNAANSKCVSADGCTTSADCATGFYCTTGFQLDFGGGLVFDLNKCEQGCNSDLDCGANTGSAMPLDTNQSWNYNKCDTTTHVCSQDDGT
ncbi:MAG TPA: PPC domain-containing protein [Kofleriaceae bacterium]|jgi:hypothetical protein